MKKKLVWWLAAAVALSAGPALAQVVNTDNDYDEDNPIEVAEHAAAAKRALRLDDNYRQLAYTLSVDRDTPYFPGEPIKVEIRITNPTSSPLEIPDPNNPALQCFTGSYEEWCRVGLRPPSTVIQPGEVIALTVNSEDKQTAKRWGLGTAPTNPGKHHLTYLLGGRVDFEVGAPVVEASAMVPLQVFKTYQEPSMARPETLQYAATLLAARLGDEHLLLIGRRNMPTTYRIQPNREDGTLSAGDAGTVAPWIRLATSPSAIASLKGTADPQGRITVEFSASDGATQTLYLNEDRHIGR